MSELNSLIAEVRKLGAAATPADAFIARYRTLAVELAAAAEVAVAARTEECDRIQHAHDELSRARWLDLARVEQERDYWRSQMEAASACIDMLRAIGRVLDPGGQLGSAVARPEWLEMARAVVAERDGLRAEVAAARREGAEVAIRALPLPEVPT